MDIDDDTHASSSTSSPASGRSEPSFDLEQEPLLDEQVQAGSSSDNRSSSVPEGSEKDASDDDGSQEESSDDDDDQVAAVLTRSEREILTLLAVDKKLASVLDLAATAVSSLDAETDRTSTTHDKLANFKGHAAEYYSALDDIQLTLRTSIHSLRQLRISPRALSENPAMGSVLRGTTVALGTLPSSAPASGIDGKDGEEEELLGKGAMRMQIEAYRDLVDALNTITTFRTVSRQANAG